MRLLICLLFGFVSLFSASFAMTPNESHLKGVNYLYMHVDATASLTLSSSAVQDLNDIMELQLRRGNIALKQYVANQPETNVPMVELSVDTSGAVGAGDFLLILKVYDFVTIDRNGMKTVADVYELTRAGTSSAGEKEVEAIKTALRDMMSEFVAAYKRQNP